MVRNRSPITIPDEFIEPINFGSLQGRKLIIPASNEQYAHKEIVFFYGHHSSLERVYSIAQYLSDYGNVTVYDIPGFGGMDSFYKIQQEPSLDTYASFMYTVLKSHKNHAKVTLIGMSLTFTMLTRMLQLYPDMAQRVNHLVSFVGFGHYRDFSFSERWRKFWYSLWYVCSYRLVTWLVKVMVLNPLSLRLMMRLFLRFNPKLKKAKSDVVQQSVQMEMYLWSANDLRTHFKTYLVMLGLDMTTDKKIPLDMYDMTTKNDQYFNHEQVQKTLEGLYSSVTTTYLNLPVHVPSLISDKREVEEIIPNKIIKEVLES